MGHLVELAKAILASAEQIENALQQQSLLIPSFDVDTLADLPPELRDDQHRLLEAADELAALVQGPRNFVSTFAQEHNRATSMHAILRFQLAKALPLDATLAPSELAKAIGQDEEKILRLLRHAMTYRIFRETDDGKIAHTAASKILAVDEDLAAFIEVALNELLPAATRVVDAMERWPGSEEPSEAGFNIANNTSDPMFVAVDKDPARAKKFAASMKGFQSSPAFSPNHLIDHASDCWGGAAKVVDIGGSSGAIAVALTERFSDVHCIVQDQPQAIESAFERIPANVASRVEFMPHDLFHAQPIKDADVYLLRWVLHDWSDLYTAHIIGNIVPAMKPGAKLIINDSVLPKINEASLFDQRFARATDMTMLAIQNGRERDEETWLKVLHQADPRLKLDGIRQPPGSALAILIVSLQESEAR